jgi:hypothetical protein
MYDCECIVCPFPDFENLEFSIKERHAEQKLWKIDIIYLNGTMGSFLMTDSEIAVNVTAAHLKMRHDIVKFTYKEIDVQEII